MCGIAGVIKFLGDVDEEMLVAMKSSLLHRGPDGNGTWRAGRVGLVHTRLAVLDPTVSGAQPMLSAEKDLVITYNGEIYNFISLKKDLKALGWRFRTHTDTEVLLAGYRYYGTRFFEKMEGMFAFALWDGKRLILGRDRFGMKPLFMTQTKDAFMFASEPKALIAGGLTPEVNPQGLLQNLVLNSSQGRETVYSNVESMDPGSYLEIFPDGSRRNSSFWSMPDLERPKIMVGVDYLDSLKAVLSDSIKRHLVSDVPIGIFLSGGIDSSLIASIAAEQGADLSAFSLSCDSVQDAKYISFVSRLAKRWKFRHEHLVLSSEAAIAALEKMLPLADEPHGDAADVGVFALSEAARSSVKVVLTGDGGDEVFAGYPRHRAHMLAARFGGLFRAFHWILPALSQVHRRRFLSMMEPEATRRYASFYIPIGSTEESSSSWLSEDLRGKVDYDAMLEGIWKNMTAKDELSSILSTDVKTILQDSYLRKVDRATMMAGIEGRLPFLDKSVVQFAFGLPKALLLSPTQGKRITRRLLSSNLADPMTHAPKMGFTLPVSDWLKSKRCQEIRDHLSSPNGKAVNILSQSALSKLKRCAEKPWQSNEQWRLLRVAAWADTWL